MQYHVRGDGKFAVVLLRERVDAMLSGDVETGKTILRDFIKATVGFEKLGAAGRSQSMACCGGAAAFAETLYPSAGRHACPMRSSTSARSHQRPSSPPHSDCDVPSRDPRRSIGFDVAGGNYRLIAAFDFRRQIVFVKFTDTMLNTMPLTLLSSPDFYNDRHANPPDPH